MAATREVRLTTPVQELPGVGPRRAQLLKRLGIATASDLLRHLPNRYEKEYSEGTIDDLPSDCIGSARGTIVATRVSQYPARPRFEATLEDHTGRINLVWFNAGYLRNKLHPGLAIRVTGPVKYFRGYPQMVNPRWEPLPQDGEADVERKGGRLRPIYPATEDLPSGVIEKLIADVLPAVIDQVPDPLPESLVRDRHMPTNAQAYRQMHLPEEEDDWKAGRRRLAYNELLLLQLGIALKRHYNRTALWAPPLRRSEAVDQHIRARFPFELTSGQAAAVRDIAADLQRDQPMNRLLQGDVGSGKTVVALYALLMAVANRRQGAIMAPTELLAEQHYFSITSMLQGTNVRVALLSAGSSPAGSAERAALLERIARGEVDIVVGTQALLTQSVTFADLAVVVVDEQHRFGVLQRAAFRSRSEMAQAPQGRQRSPHYLVMTATPIPRTLSLTVFGDLDVSIIRGLPPGRAPITTRVVPPEKADDVYSYMAKRVRAGEQAYVVVPTIDASGSESAKELKSVGAHQKLLQDKYCQGLKVGAIHGRLKPQTREQIMQRFRAGQIHVLVATTVIEVGVDVPNATLMVVEHAERFGLAQLHQLRGRIGRGNHGRRSVCALIAEPTTDDAAARMKAIASTTDGFKIAEEDFNIRGMGEFFGTRQHGQPPLRVAAIPQDMDLLQLAKRDAEALVKADPHLDQPQHALLKKVLMQQFGDALGLIDVG